jgi:hypothetical protein
MRTSHVASAAIAAIAFTLTLAAARVARADDGPKNPWIERPLALKPLTAEIQAGVGVGQTYDPVSGHGGAGTGANLEAGIGLPILGDINVRTGYRFDSTGQAAGADFYGRTFDHQMILTQLGGDKFANPEIRWRNALVDAEVIAVGLETRFLVPLADHTYFSASPGVPVRIRIPHLARIDTGLYVPIAFTDNIQYTFSIPAELWFQVKDFFFGPMTGFRFDHIETAIATVMGTTTSSNNQVDIQAGLGAGYTLGGMLDLKAQVYTLRINDSNWANTIGAGLGVGLLLP